MKLNALFVKNAPPGKYEDGHGLRLIKRADGSGQWVFRYTCLGRRREMGLGGLAALSLRDAREIAAEYRGMVARDIDPIEQRKARRRQAINRRRLLTEVAKDAYESRQAEL